MAQATSSGERALGEMVEDVLARLHDRPALGEPSLVRVAGVMRQFGSFLECGHGIRSLEEVRPEVVGAFLVAPTSDGGAPSRSLQQLRRWVVRLLFRTARQQGLDVGDPSVDARLSASEAVLFRPLWDSEVDIARASVAGSARLLPASVAWSLCEATARTGELPNFIRADIALEVGRAWIRGTPRTRARWGYLSDWGAAQVARHLATLPDDPAHPVLLGRSGDRTLPQSSAVGLIAKTLTRSGLAIRPGVRPSSVAAWAGRQVLDDTDRIDLVAQRLGMSSLDGAAHFIGWNWSPPT